MASILWINRKAGELSSFFFCKRVKRGAANNAVVVFHHLEIINFHFNPLAATFYQYALSFKWLDQLQNRTHIINVRLTHRFQAQLGDHGADTFMCE